VVGVPVALLWAMHVVRRAQEIQDRFFVDTKPIEIGVIAAARETGAPMLRLASGAFVLFRREAFSLTFFLVALATARRAAYPALLAGGLAVVGGTLAAYRYAIEDGIRRRSHHPVPGLPL